MTRRESQAVPRRTKPAPTGTFQPKTRAPFCVAVLVAVILLVYSSSLKNGFVYDDNQLIVNNPAVGDLSNIPRTFTQGYYPGLQYYRPIGLISHMLDHAVWELRPIGYHLTNVLAHVVASVLVFVLFLRFEPSRSAFLAALGAAAVACHPAVTSAVMPIAARESVFCLLFTAASVLLFVRGTLRSRIGAHICLAMGLLSKEIAVIVPVLWVAADVLEARRRGATYHTRRLAGLLPALAIVIAYGMARELALDTPGIFVPYAKRVLYFFGSWLYLAQTLICPTAHVLYEPGPQAWLSRPRGVVAGLVVAGVIVLALRSPVSVRPYVKFWLAWLVLTFLPTSNLVSQETRWDERYLLLPAVGAAGLVLALLSNTFSQPSPRRGPVAVLLVAGVAILTLLGVRRSRYWVDDLAFYANWARTEPTRAKAHLGLGIELARRGETERGVEAIGESLRLHPDFSAAHVELGRILLARHQPEDARLHFEHAVRISPEYGQAHAGLGDALAALARPDQALQAYRRAIRLEPNRAEAFFGLAAVLASLEGLDEAAAAYRAGLNVRPADVAARNNLGLLLIRQGKDREARAELYAALGREPGSRDVANNLAWLLATSQDTSVRDAAEAVRLAQGVCDADSADDPNHLDTLAAALAASGRFSEAVAAGKRAAAAARGAGLTALAEDLERRCRQYAERAAGGAGR